MQMLVRTTLLYGYETRPVRKEDKKRLETIGNDSLHHVERCNHHNRIPSAIHRQRLQLQTPTASPFQVGLRWLRNTVHGSPSEILRESINSGALRTWSKRTTEDYGCGTSDLF